MKSKKPLTILFTVLCQLSIAQTKLPIIKATAVEATIIEGNSNEKEPWWLDPAAKPDIHTITKSPKAKWITFRTDIDSIKIKLRPGQKFDFIVLLNGKDSCFTRLQSQPRVLKYARQAIVSRDTVPFVLTEFNNIQIRAVLNGSDTLFLKFDSGSTGLRLTHEAIARRTSTLLPQTSESSGAAAKPDYRRMRAFNQLKIGNLSWDSLRVRPVQLSGQGTDGRFGWDLFDGRAVEIDFDRQVFIVHSALPKISGGYSKLPIEYSHGLFCISGALENKGKKYPNRFLFDNGYQRTIMLDSALMARQGFPKDLSIIKTVVMQDGQGKKFPVVTINNERLRLGKTVLSDIPAQKLNGENPADFEVHILGNEVLKRFNTFLDFYGNFIYLKPNSLFFLPYKDAS